MTGAPLSLRDYAAHRGVSHVAVSKAIAAGRLAESVVYVQRGKKRSPKIADVELADREWDSNTDTRRQAPEVRAPEQAPALEREAAAQVDAGVEAALRAAQAKASKAPKQRLAFGDKPDGELESGGRQVASTEIGLQLRKAQAVRAISSAKLDQLKVERLAGTLVEVQAVKREAGEIGHQLQTSLSGIGNRLADLVAAETDPATCQRMIDDEIGRAVEGFVRHQLAAHAAPA